MLRGIVARISHGLKQYRMSDILKTASDAVRLSPKPPGESSPGASSMKRDLEETGDELADSRKDKKQKTEQVAPMQGRLDRKRKVALLLTYCGNGYYGMQINVGFPTIEDTLCKALVAAEAIPQDHAETMSKMQFQRAARTDKGVSARGQVVSLKMMLNNDSIIEDINKHLPPQIRALAYQRTTKNFNSKNHCSGRTYVYMLPTYSFAPVEKFINEEYRTTEDVIKKVNEVLQNFKGTHNFHNYTSGIKPKDPSAKRYMISLECGEPFVRDNVEFAIIRIKGQSFMLHHIRKMIGVTIAIVRGLASEDLVTKSWGVEKVDIPKAPGLGLMLEQLHYDAYNRRFGSDGLHEPIDWSKYQPEIEKFAEEYIFSHIVKSEKEERSMFTWLTTLHHHSFDVREDDRQTVTPLHAAQKNVDRLNQEIEEQNQQTQQTGSNDAISTVEDAENGDDKLCGGSIMECEGEIPAKSHTDQNAEGDEKNPEGSELSTSTVQDLSEPCKDSDHSENTVLPQSEKQAS